MPGRWLTEGCEARISSPPTLRQQKRSQHEPLVHFVSGAAGTTRSESPWAGAGPVVAGRCLRAFVPGSPGAPGPSRRRASEGLRHPGECAVRGGGRRAAGGRCGVAAGRRRRPAGGAGAFRAAGRGRARRETPRSPRLPEGGRSPQTLLRRQAGDSWSEGSSGRRRASRLEGSEEDWAVRVRAWLGLLPGQVQEEQAPGPEPPGGSAGIPRASPVRASRKSTRPPIPLVPRVEERPGSRCQSRGSTCSAVMLPLSTIGGQGREEVQTRPPQRRALPFESTTGQRREPARKNARVSAKRVSTCPMPGFCFTFYMDSNDSEFDSQPSPGSSRAGSKYTSPSKPRAKYQEIQAWECPLCCLSVLYIS
ncbi:collagen alpha-1(I) chain [Bubalus bubalis]|uniref:collagen alpha-1(I) chain n=1 Tax=Bubalus bubalis TaxID=89462 RepID=UPI000DBC56B2|nr:collagen alpha-1(I) chain [Bubalus bubalis]